ncbi:hypothetical protein [Paenibacillus sp. 481]|uniref:hypothetical protein n=1 Tax=Paenibacillus sp. 481 TaxID=2835869 RepID=UPI001E2A3D0F|nr:hypothetical protein [Paenibacillus sp. 481]UHA75023.1 hypothetical protein KIK04_08355 [Paenibacillus sp. 481]
MEIHRAWFGYLIASRIATASLTRRYENGCSLTAVGCRVVGLLGCWAGCPAVGCRAAT